MQNCKDIFGKTTKHICIFQNIKNTQLIKAGTRIKLASRQILSQQFYTDKQELD